MLAQVALLGKQLQEGAQEGQDPLVEQLQLACRPSQVTVGWAAMAAPLKVAGYCRFYF
jgi:hypothetical protein